MKILSQKQLEAFQVNADTVEALSRSQAMIEFEPNGTIVRANENFLAAMGYTQSEIAGKHHRMFVEQAEANGPDYTHFWSDLAEGKFKATTFKRIGKGGKEVWLEASYNPVIDKAGKTYRVVKFATDVTRKHQAAADFQRQSEAASASQAVIEFDLDGTILAANQNFCDAMGYRRDELVGKHHRIFVDESEAQTSQYREFWKRLGSGQYQAAEYLRYGKGGKTVWIQASYNPVFDADGRPYKVIKYATDVSQRKAAVAELDQSLSRLADGDLSGQITHSFPPELESIRLAFNAAAARLSDTMRELRTTSAGVRSATEEILSGANDLSSRTMRQSSAISQASASAENLSKAVTQTAQGATAAVDNAKTVDEVARNAQGVMEDATKAMGQISADSTTISNIVTLIDDIAFQTNLLALNASVEAARAGDAGKGFAVVAIEVRRLAQSAAVASRDISNVIENSGQAVRRGTDLVAAAAARLREMVQKVGQSYELASKIADDNQRQSLTVLDLKKIMGELDEMTQHNAALVEQTNAAIEQTEGQAKRLDELVDVFVFDTKGNPTGTVAAQRRRSAA